jgi:hypothetical protein
MMISAPARAAFHAMGIEPLRSGDFADIFDGLGVIIDQAETVQPCHEEYVNAQKFAAHKLAFA